MYLGILLVLGHPTVAQVNSSQNQERLKKIRDIKRERDQELELMRAQYLSYAQKQKSDFGKFLEQEWKAFKIFQGEKINGDKKPKAAPAFKKGSPLTKESEIKHIDIKITPLLNKAPQGNKLIAPTRVVPVTPTPEQALQAAKLTIPQIPNSNNVVQATIVTPPDTFMPASKIIKSVNLTDVGDGFLFYGLRVDLPIPESLLDFRLEGTDEKNIGSAWERANVEMKGLADQIGQFRHDFYLNDWAQYLLSKRVAKEMSVSGDEHCFLLWCLLKQEGFDVRLGRKKGKLICMCSSVQTMYGCPYLRIDKRKYYLLDSKGDGSIYTYDKDVPSRNNERSMDFRMVQTPMFQGECMRRKMEFKYKGEIQHLELNYSKGLIDFYRDYPLVDLEVFLNAPLSQVTFESIENNVVPVLNPLSKETRLEFLLDFVQHAVAYQTDQQQFGREKYFFPEELLYYPYADCEDRTAFLGSLVRELHLGETVGIVFEGHAALGVCVPNREGDFLTYDNKRFLVADPTYINAPLGRMMPKFKGTKAKVIPLR